MRVNIIEQIEVRLEPGSRTFTPGRPSGPAANYSGWLSQPHDAPVDPASLLLAVDAYPPATTPQTGWVPTFQLTGDVRTLPAPQLIRDLQ